MMNKDLLTVGELAKAMGITVRTLQYYDNEGVLKASAKSEGGRRLYTKKDMVKLHQILSLKHLGFSLDEIKNNLMNLDTPDEVVKFLNQQREVVKEQIDKLQLSLSAIDALHNEVIKMEEVDFGKYADIISFLRHNIKDYWMIKLFDDKLLSQMKLKYMKNPQKGLDFYELYKTICDETINLKEKGVSPKSEEGLMIAEKWWLFITEFTGGDMSLLPSLMKFNDNKSGWDEEMKNKQAMIDDFLNQALGLYFERENIVIPEMEV